MKIGCVIAAAGRGARSGLPENKVLYRLNGRSVLSRCIDALSAPAVYDEFVLVTAADEQDTIRELLAAEGTLSRIAKIVAGGETRRDSVLNGLRALSTDTDIVSIHDAARPFVTEAIIRATVEDACAFGSGVISTPVVDTIKITDGTGSVVTPDRSTLRAVQTPQTFDYRRLITAYETIGETCAATDDAMLYERMYGTVHLSSAPGAERNVKLTMPEDFERRTDKTPRMGTGYDAHRLKEGRKLILCGVDVPHDRGLDGHSDADVAVHALMDAMLGALALGDIGKHFPDTDPRYKGISSLKLLEHVTELVGSRGYTVGNIDITIVAQKPKLAPHMEMMRLNVARTMGVSVDLVSVKATTTERMGFEGEETGISAQAVAVLVPKH